MMNHRYLVVMFTAGALIFGAGRGRAQSAAPAEPQAPTFGPLAKPGGPPPGCKNGQGMQCTTNDMRWKAAAHNSDRHGDDVRKNNGKDKGKDNGHGKGKH
jgi:hypothetical protein